MKRRITTIKNELGHFGVPEKRLNHISRLAWAATKTDFTQAEQDERQLLLLNVTFVFFICVGVHVRVIGACRGTCYYRRAAGVRVIIGELQGYVL